MAASCQSPSQQVDEHCSQAFRKLSDSDDVRVVRQALNSAVLYACGMQCCQSQCQKGACIDTYASGVRAWAACHASFPGTMASPTLINTSL